MGKKSENAGACSSSPSVNSVASHHVPVVAFLNAHVDLLLYSTSIWLPPFNDVRSVYGDIGVEVGRVDPIAGKIIRQLTAGFQNFGFHLEESDTSKFNLPRFPPLRSLYGAHILDLT